MSDAEVNDRQTGVLYPGSAEFRKAIADAPADRRDLMERLADWAEALKQDGLVSLVSYVGKNGGVTLLPRLAADNAGLVTIYADSKPGPLQFWPSVFERRAPRSIDPVQAVLGAELTRGKFTASISEQLLTTLTNAYREAVSGTTTHV